MRLWRALGVGLGVALAAAPAQDPATVQAGLEAAKRGDCPAVLARLRAVVSTPSPPPAVLNAVGVCESRTGHPERATALFERLTRLSPGAWQAWNNLGANLLALNRPAEAEAAFRRAIQLAPGSASALANLGRALDRQGKPREAFAALDRAQRAAPKDREVVAEWLRLAEILATQAAGAIEGKQYGRARELLQAVARPLDGTPSWHNLLGYAEFKTGHPEPALQHLQKALQLEPDNEDFLLDVAEFLAHHQAHERTLELFAVAARRQPHSARVQYGLALAYVLQNRRDEATRILEGLVDRQPGFAAAYRVLGECYEDAARYPAMIELGRKLQTLDPRDGFGWYLDGRGHLGLGRQGAGALEPAIEALRQSVARNPDFARAHFQLARALEESGQPELAEQALRETIRLEPQHPRAHYVLGRLYQKLGKTAEARSELAIHSRMKEEDRKATYRRLLVVSRP